MAKRASAQRFLKTFVFVLCLIPFLLLLVDAFVGRLGANPITEITHRTGLWTLRMLMITLAVTPLRRLSGWSSLANYRRMLGLFAFFYASLHFLTYLVLDQFFDWSTIVPDIAKRPYITVGFTSLLLLVPLAVTSTKKMIRRLGGKRWRRLHRLVYFAALGGVVHYLWLVKADTSRPLAYGALLALLMGIRLWFFVRGRAGTPAELFDGRRTPNTGMKQGKRKTELLVGALCGCLIGFAAEAQAPEKRQPKFKAEAYAGLLEVRVTDPAGKPVTNLKRQDFEVLEDGKLRPLVFFRREESVPVSIGILVDTGSTMSSEYVSQAREMVFELVHLLDKEDEILLASYDREVHFLTQPTTDRHELVEALWNVAAWRKKKSFLNDIINGSDSNTGGSVDFTLLELKRAKHQMKAVLVISAGFGNIGEATLDHLRLSGARFFAISFKDKAADVLNLGGDQMARRRIVRETGGISYSPEEVFRKMEVMRDGLKNVYLLAYQPAESGDEKIEVRAPSRKECDVHFAPRVSSTDSFF